MHIQRGTAIIRSQLKKTCVLAPGSHWHTPACSFCGNDAGKAWREIILTAQHWDCTHIHPRYNFSKSPHPWTHKPTAKRQNSCIQSGRPRHQLTAGQSNSPTQNVQLAHCQPKTSRSHSCLSDYFTYWVRVPARGSRLSDAKYYKNTHTQRAKEPA